MSLIRGSVNPLNVLEIRKLSFSPSHFAKTYVENIKDMYDIDKWIYKNLNSRYCIKKSHTLDRNNKIVEMCEIGLEDPRELTLLSLACPHLHKI
jgi:hypothetical protein